GEVPHRRGPGARTHRRLRTHRLRPDRGRWGRRTGGDHRRGGSVTEALFPLDAAFVADQARARGANRPDVGSQWRLSEIQIANWGTFDADIHRIPVSHKGHLITGPSGSGKSS